MELAFFSLTSQHGAHHAAADALRDAAQQVVLAEQVGFDVAWFAEHHFSSHSVCASPLMMAAHCAALTRRIRLGPAVVVLPLHHPLRVVQEFGMLDALSGGRAVLGLGTGHQPHEFRTYGVDLAERAAILEEGWEVLEQGLTRGEVEHHGRHYDIPRTPVARLRAEAGMPPLYLAGAGDALLRRGARGRATPLVSQGFKPPEAMLPARAQVERCFAEGGGAGEAPFGVQRYVFVSEDPAEMRAAAEGMLRMSRNALALRAEHPGRDGAVLRAVPYAGEPTVEWLLEHAPIGPAGRVAEVLARDVSVLRPSHMSLYMSHADLPQGRLMAALERLGERVLPMLRAG